MNKKALISVWDKTNILEFSKLLIKRNFEILSTGGTKSFLEKNNIPVTSVSDLTGYGSIMDGRVKTLHPKIFGGILADRENQAHLNDLELMKSNTIDLVVVNLYPFVSEAIKNKLPMEKAIEYIDIGGPSMLRAAAKNYKSVVPISDINDYEKYIADYDFHKGQIPIKIRKGYAIKIFHITTQYDSNIKYYLDSINKKKQQLPDSINININKSIELRYGENPHQKAGYYISEGGKEDWKQLQGKQLSYNNYTDIDSAISIVKDFNRSSCSIIKHANPCGFAIGKNNIEAFNRSVRSDPVSYFGGIVGFNGLVNVKLANILIKPFLECIVAPDFDSKSLDVFKTKKNLRIIKINENYQPSKHTIKNALGGFIFQDTDTCNINLDSCEVVTKKKPSKKYRDAMKLGWKLIKYVKSNAIIFANDKQLLGVGAGQMSRVDSVKIAIRKVEESGLSLDGAIMVSDAFFPFSDSLEIAAKAGIKSVIQPGGSIKDSEIINVADELNLSMVFTRIRHFYH